MVSRVSSFSRRRIFALLVGPMAVGQCFASVFRHPGVGGHDCIGRHDSLNETKQFDFASGCAVFLAGQGLCGSGVAVPYGHATETIVFGGCGFGPVRCDLRTVSGVGRGRNSDCLTSTWCRHKMRMRWRSCRPARNPGRSRLTVGGVGTAGSGCRTRPRWG